VHSNQGPLNSVSQHTLKAPISYVGIGLHTGKKVSMTVHPSEPNSGINFIRKDVSAAQAAVVARWYNVVDTRLSTVIGNEYGVTVATIEHLMAALRGTGVDNATVEIDGPEVPILDGSSQPFVELIERSGREPQPSQRWAIWIHQPISAYADGRYALLLPDTRARITVEIDFPSPVVGAQKLSVDLDQAFRQEVAPARTFGFAHEIHLLRKRGFALGGSLRNAILVSEDRVINEEGLRYPDEFVRHKILDCLGDLALAGVPIIGHYCGYKPGHQLNNELVRTLFSKIGGWSYLTIDEFDELLGRGRRRTPLQKPDDTMTWGTNKH
jgi:UDP-3-O-[3-hydroxymyristoyl] N-acetylglucosamine deacetylase